MKKILFAALTAMTMVFMSSCGQGASTEYTQGGPQPSIDSKAGTVNGRHYNTTDYNCYCISYSFESLGGVNGETTKTSKTEYVWGTEFDVVSTAELAMWTTAQSGTLAKGSYAYLVYIPLNGDKLDYNSCDNLNKNK
ncbi:MAG: hypothetical protein II901_02870 [Paludibacteraceae bacterium]|nr:hypothetical protein [Paludibacteraceae bacterium]